MPDREAILALVFSKSTFVIAQVVLQNHWRPKANSLRSILDTLGLKLTKVNDLECASTNNSLFPKKKTLLDFTATRWSAETPQIANDREQHFKLV